MGWGALQARWRTRAALERPLPPRGPAWVGEGSLSESGRPWGQSRLSPPGPVCPGTQWAVNACCPEVSGHAQAMGVTRSPEEGGTMHTCLGASGARRARWGMWDLQARPCRLCRSLTMDPQGPGFPRAVPQGHWPAPSPRAKALPEPCQLHLLGTGLGHEHDPRCSAGA